MRFSKFILNLFKVTCLMLFFTGCVSSGVNLVRNGSTNLKYQNFPKAYYPDAYVYQENEKLLVTGVVLWAGSANIDIDHIDISLFSSAGELLAETSTSLERRSSGNFRHRNRLHFRSTFAETLPKKSTVVVSYHGNRHETKF